MRGDHRQIGKRVTRSTDITVLVGVASAELAAAVYSVTNLYHANLDRDDFVALYQAAYNLILAIMRSKPVTGEVPLPIFQLLASFRPRVVDLGGQAVYSVKCIQSAAALPKLPPPPTTEDYSEFTMRAAALGGVLMDLTNLGTTMVGPFPTMGYHSVVSIGSSLGPLNIYAPANNRYSAVRIQTLNMSPTEEWMKYITWASAFTDYHEYDIVTTNFMQPETYSEVTPGSIIIATALQRADVVGCKAFRFPAVDLACVKAFIDANLAARNVANASTEVADYHNDLRAALVVCSGVGLRAGQVAFDEPYNALSNFQLPQDIVESVQLLPTFRNSVARIPFVYTRTANSPQRYQNNYADGTTAAIEFGNTVSETNGIIGISNAEMSYGSSAFYNNTFLLQATTTGITWAGASPNWGESNATTTGDASVDWSSLFRNTISNGPLARPAGNKVMTALNFTDLTAGRYTVTDTASNKTVVGYSTIKSLGGGLQGPNLALLLSLPIPREAICPENPVGVAYHQTPNDQIQQRIDAPAVAATPHTVTDDSAKYTELQQFFQNLAVNGLGGDGLFGDIVKKNGQQQFLRRNARSLGFSLLGKTLIASNCPPQAPGTKRKQRPQMKKPMRKQNQPRKSKRSARTIAVKL